MSKYKLFVDRFAVYGMGKFVYDQRFHVGVNIIRGANGTGKSTIMDLLNYSLGSESADWTKEQSRCDYVMTQVSINGHTATLKRDITVTGKEKILFFDGDMEVARVNQDGWQKYPMRRSSDVNSFSQHIFELLNMPRHKTDDDKNLTMHQVLRLMYVDQLSATTKLLKEDSKYDNVTIRRAIGEYLLGIDSLEAFNLRQELIQADRLFDKIDSELKAIYKLFGSDQTLINEQSLDNEIGLINKQIEELEAERVSVNSQLPETLSAEMAEKTKQLRSAVETTSNKISILSAEKRELSIELQETQHFLKSLEERKASLSEAKLTLSVLGQVSFDYCPSCLEPIITHTEGCCDLCKTPHQYEAKDYAYSQFLNELNFQIKESKKLIESFKSDLLKVEAQLSKARHEFVTAKEKLKEMNVSSDDREAKLLNLASELGFFRSQTLSLEEKREQVSKVDELQKSKHQENARISALKDELERISAMQEKRYVEVYSAIESKAKSLLQLDGGYEEAFKSPEEVTFDFGIDKMFVNGNSKFSASSMVVMKNSIRFAIFANAADDDYARLPNLLLMDNIEDKGMQTERSQNFQNQMVKLAGNIQNDFQLIFTTSMIADELDGTDLCVGPFYQKGMHTLVF
ncbi:MAG: AAA family ATPase [Methyloprofundus sp.]|nr:AAA family ATPase [Methyloprofundus sp.]